MTDDRISRLYTAQLDILAHDLVSLAREVPAEAYDFRPSAGMFDGVRTFGEQVKHFATTTSIAAARIARRAPRVAPGPGDNGPESIQGKDAVLAYLDASLADARAALAILTEATQWDAMSTVFGPQSRAEIAAALVYHGYCHYGQMVVYARLVGVVPPASRPRPAITDP
jgi:uncharacterized damage-inducible protein DinB